MACVVNKLTALGVLRTKEPGRYGDGAGLYLVIDPGGSRRWIMIFRQGGRQREMGLGSANVVSLADARRRRDETHRLISEGCDPIAKKRRPDPSTAKAVTFGAFADALVPELSKGFRNAKHRAQWTSTLNTYATPLRFTRAGLGRIPPVGRCRHPRPPDRSVPGGQGLADGPARPLS